MVQYKKEKVNVREGGSVAHLIHKNAPKSILKDDDELSVKFKNSRGSVARASLSSKLKGARGSIHANSAGIDFQE